MDLIRHSGTRQGSLLLYIALAALALALLPLRAEAADAPATDIRAQARTLASQGILGNLAQVNDALGSHEFVMAGAHQYYTYWSRDFSWSSAGLIDIGHPEAVRDTLEFALTLQRDDGLIPRDIESGDPGERYILGAMGIRLPYVAPFTPGYVSENGVITIDTNVIVPWAAAHYVMATGDHVFAEKWFTAAEQAIQYLEANYYQDGLIAHQPPFSDWEDSVARTGRVAYTNELYVMALRGMADWAALLGLSDKATYYTARAADTTQKFNDFFWYPRRGMVRNFEGDERLTLDANLMAVAYDIVPDDEKQIIMNTLRHSVLWNPIPGRATWPAFPVSMKSALPPLVGNLGYHDTDYWIWMTGLAAMAEKKVGNVDGCNTILDQASQLIIRDGTPYENYILSQDNGVSTITPKWDLLYHSEGPFTWACGVMLHAYAGGCTN